MKDCRGVLGRLRAWRELGGGVREIGGAIRGRKEVLGRFRAELEQRQRWELVSLGKAHSEAVRGIEHEAGAAYRDGMEGSQERAELAARTGGMSAHYDPPIDGNALRRSVMQERMEQLREIDGEQAYEKMCRAVERPANRPPRMFRRAVGRSVAVPNAAGRSGTLAPAAKSLGCSFSRAF